MRPAGWHHTPKHTKKYKKNCTLNLTRKIGLVGHKLTNEEIIKVYVLGNKRRKFLENHEKRELRPEGIFTFYEIGEMFGIAHGSVIAITIGNRKHGITKDVIL